MAPQQVLLFVPTALLLALAPGPDNLGVLSLGVSTGRRAAVGFALGCSAGCINHTVLAVAGISALVATSPMALGVAQYLGAAYLCWIAFQTLRSMRAPRDSALTLEAQSRGNRAWLHFKRGLISNAVNPKVALFFLAFLPQFVVPGPWPSWLQLATLGCLFALSTCAVFIAIALGAAWIGAQLGHRPALKRVLEGVTAIVFLTLGFRLAFADLHAG